MDRKYVLEKLRKKKLADPNFIAFGAQQHQYKLRNPIDPRQLLKLEKQFKINLPKEHRQFLLNVGDGGAGPSYGLYSLKGALTGKDPIYKKYDGFYWDDGQPDKVFAKPTHIFDESSNGNGILILCQHGCANDDYLVINGEERGFVWHFVDWAGFIPCVKNPPEFVSRKSKTIEDADRIRNKWAKILIGVQPKEKMTFVEWYSQWLNSPPESNWFNN